MPWHESALPPRRIAVNHFARRTIQCIRQDRPYIQPCRSQLYESKGGTQMNSAPRLRIAAFVAVLAIIAGSSLNSWAQSCQTSGELDDATRSAITTAAQRYFDMAAKGDAASLKQNAIASLASDFSGIEGVVTADQPDLAGGQATVKSLFLLDGEGTAANPHAEFYCGVFGKNGQTSNSAAFYLDNLPPGKYSVVILDATSSKARTQLLPDSATGRNRLETCGTIREGVADRGS